MNVLAAARIASTWDRLAFICVFSSNSRPLAVRNLIRDEKVQMIYSTVQTGARFGMQTMQDAIDDLIAAERITKEEAERAMMIMGGAVSAGDPQDAPPPPAQKSGDGAEAAPQRRSVSRKLTKKEETGRYSF